MVDLDIWEPVTSKSQLKKGSVLKIIGINPKNSYDEITVKKVLEMNGPRRQWTEILINKRKNYYFHLDAYLGKEVTWGKWVDKLYVKKVPIKKNCDACACLSWEDGDTYDPSGLQCWKRYEALGYSNKADKFTDRLNDDEEYRKRSKKCFEPSVCGICKKQSEGGEYCVKCFDRDIEPDL